MTNELTHEQTSVDCVTGDSATEAANSSDSFVTNKSSNKRTTSHPTTLFVSPKQGGILQSSGFLDLKNLMALNRTCKANMIDELSVMLLIENEITRYHGVNTMKEAIDFWRLVCHRYPLLKQWLGRDGSNCVESITVTRYMLSDAALYEVMLAKMLRTVPTQPERLQLVSRKCAWTGETVLHCAAYSGNPESIRLILALYPETELLRIVNVQDDYGWVALHCAARSGNFESIETILDVYPESERLQALNTTNHEGETVWHRVADSNNIECIKAVLSLLPESQRLQAANRKNENGYAMLDDMNEETHTAIMRWLSM